jgi:glutathione synthase/RimK-type ligase-like ATP-grasp enzyme
MTIALLGDPEDLAAVYIGWLASKRHVEVVWLPEQSLGTEWSFSIDELGTEANLRLGERWQSFSELSGVFVRFNPNPPLPPGLTLTGEFRSAFLMERREGLHQLLEVLPCKVINRPSAGRANASKPYQMRTLAQAGFCVPPWVVTNRDDALAAFEAEHSNVCIYKATSGLRSRVRRVDGEFRHRLSEGTTPTVVQQFIAGRDVRVHTVGDDAFATEVLTDAIDYRFEQGSKYRVTEIGFELAQLCCETAKREELMLAGFDFRVTEDDRWYCLEMNPVPSFLPYEMCSGVPIGDAIVNYMCGDNSS